MFKCNCGQDFYDQDKLKEHQKRYCKEWYFCGFCKEYVALYDKVEHLNQCGSKMNQCPKCFKSIPRGIYNYHLENNCIYLNEDDTFNKQDLFEATNDHSETLIPCEFCEKPIKLSLYESHATNCRRNFGLLNTDVDHDTHKKDTKTGFNTSKLFDSNTFNDTQTSEEGQSEILNRSFGRMNFNSNEELVNNSKTDQFDCKENAATIAHKKTEDVSYLLEKDYFPNEVKHATDKLQFNILLMGSPRVGKSQLINTLCGDAHLAKTSSSLNSCTQKIERYVLEDNQEKTPGVEPFRIYFYDTPGIESWTNQNGQEIMLKFIEEKNPICLIYCASPGSFADLNQLQPILNLCQTKNIFCALVCTNMWANPNRKIVIQEFEKQLSFFGKRVEKLFGEGQYERPHKVIHFGDGALCTMVNSIEYYDPDISDKRQPVQGVNELTHCIMEKLDHDKLLGFCNAVLYQRSLWEKVSQKVNGFFLKSFPKISNGMTADQIAIDFAYRLFEKFIN